MINNRIRFIDNVAGRDLIGVRDYIGINKKGSNVHLHLNILHTRPVHKC